MAGSGEGRPGRRPGSRCARTGQVLWLRGWGRLGCREAGLPRALPGHLPPLRCPAHPPTHSLQPLTSGPQPSGNLRPGGGGPAGASSPGVGASPAARFAPASFLWGLIALTWGHLGGGGHLGL